MRKDDRLNTLALRDTNENHDLLTLYSQRDALPSSLTKPELAELKWSLKTLSGFSEDGVYRYHENGFDYLPTPIITAGDPEKFKLFRWGLIPYYMTDKEKAMILRTQTLNCISEEMYEKPSFRDAAKNEQRCLIPVTGFYKWRWLDEAGTVKIPYYVTFRDGKVRSMGGLTVDGRTRGLANITTALAHERSFERTSSGDVSAIPRHCDESVHNIKASHN